MDPIRFLRASTAKLKESYNHFNFPKAEIYSPLNSIKSEVRMLTIVDSHDDTHGNLIHCELETVSLDDLNTDFEEILTEYNAKDISNPKLIQAWLDMSTSSRDDDKKIWFPTWRRELQRLEILGKVSSDEWDNIMTDAGIDLSLLYRTWPPNSSDPNSTIAGSPGSRRSNSPLIPRFGWGDFEAVSYCWDSDVKEQLVVVNGKIVPVPRNLEAMLRRLKDLPETESGMKYWVDALCINQDDLEERTLQVNLMRRIYKCAFATISWLGPSLPDSNVAICLIANLARRTLTNWKLEFPNDHSFANSKDLKLMPWSVLLSFLSRDYWRRLWIIQELALNHNMTLFLCGQYQLSRNLIREACNFCMRNAGIIDIYMGDKLEDAFLFVAPLNRSVFPTVYHVNTLVTLSVQLVENDEAITILDLCKKASALKPVDKVYGLLGILPSSLAKTITPDYRLSERTVYIQFANAILKETNRIDSILSWCSFEPNSVIPSWVPNWTLRFHRNHLQFYRMQNASAQKRTQSTLSDDNNLLTCKGIFADTIVSTSGSPSENLPYKSQCKFVKSSGKLYIPHHYETKEKLTAALRRVLTQVRPNSANYHKPDEDLNPLNICWVDWKSIGRLYPTTEIGYITKSSSWEAFDRFRQSNAYFSLFGHDFKDFFPRTPQHGAEYDWRIKFPSLTLIGRRLMTTVRGYLGLVPEETQVGDLIAVLYGCNYPVVLRKKENKFLYIGECYVDGIMNGEVVESMERGELGEADIVLC